jgi:hypothetical protein
MRESRMSGSVEGVLSNGHPYSDSDPVNPGCSTNYYSSHAPTR